MMQTSDQIHDDVLCGRSPSSRRPNRPEEEEGLLYLRATNPTEDANAGTTIDLGH
jgi:hypothetical protein